MKTSGEGRRGSRQEKHEDEKGRNKHSSTAVAHIGRWGHRETNGRYEVGDARVTNTHGRGDEVTKDKRKGEGTRRKETNCRRIPEQN